MGTLLAVHLLIFSLIRDMDMSWLIPAVKKHIGWPDLPHFMVQQDTTSDGEKETLYTVPTHQFTAQERAQLQSNAPPSSAP